MRRTQSVQARRPADRLDERRITPHFFKSARELSLRANATEPMQQTNPKPDSPTFITEGVTKVYGVSHAAVHALPGVDLQIPQVEMAVLLGPSGSGKSRA